LLRSWAVLEDPVQEALHRLKYRRDVGLGDALSVQFAGFCQSLGLQADLVVPIPLGRERLRERGYNQVSLIARPLAYRLGLAFSTAALARSRETRSQVGLSRERRRENVRGAFYAERSVVSGRTVLIIDDVATTGSTLSAAAAALRLAGANHVVALTVARALPGRGSRAPDSV
jgi:ComF family protein